MKTALKMALAVAAIGLAAQATAQVTFYEGENFEGRSFTTRQPVDDLARLGFNDRASSVVVASDRWEVCEDARFSGRCVILLKGNYSSLAAMGLDNRVSSLRTMDSNTRIDDGRYAPAPVAPRLTFYENDNFGGRSFVAENEVADFKRAGFNDAASSAVVVGQRWEVCEDARFGGRCTVLRPGNYASLSAMGLNDRISSVRSLDAAVQVAADRYAPVPSPSSAYARRGNERLYEAPVTSVRAVVAQAEQRCWIEREEVAQSATSNVNVPGAIVGAVIGGILGHQVGGGVGKQLATAGGAVAGGALGSQVGRDGNKPARTQEVQRCATAPATSRPDYWDVTYNFQGQEHRVQMTTPPGATVTVNGQGEPRA